MGVLTYLLFSACTGSSPELSSPERPQSTPVRVELRGGEPPPLPELAEPDVLQSVVPALVDLEQLELYLAVGVMNLVPAPCEPCFADRTLGVCLLDPPAGCENLPALAERAATMAKAGVDQKQLRAALSYAEPWIPDETAEDAPDAVDVELWLRPGTPGADAVFQRVDAVRAAAGPFQLHIRPIGDTAGDLLARGLVAADAQGKAREYMQLSASLSEDVTEAALVDEAVKAGMEREPFVAAMAGATVNMDVIRSKGVRSSPTWFVEGYRLRGLQSVEAIGRLVQLEAPPTTTPNSTEP